MDGAGNMTISGIVYVEGGTFDIIKNNNITYTGSGSLLVTGDVNINGNLTTPATASSFPTNVVGIMTPGQVNLATGNGASQVDVMGLFYGETRVNVAKQSNIMGTIVSNYFNMGTNVPNIYQVPEVVNHLPIGLIGQSANWTMSIVSWRKI